MLSNIQRSILIRALRLRAEAGENPADILAGYTKITEEEKAELLKEVGE